MILYTQVHCQYWLTTFKVSFKCNHEEADTRMIFHALTNDRRQKTNVVVCSKDTDVLVLKVFVHTLNKFSEK